MKICVRGSGSRRLLRKLEKSGAIELVGGSHNDLFFDASWPDPKLEEFLQSAAKYGSFDLNPWMSFHKAEVQQAAYLHPRTRKAITDSNNDYERMRSHFDELPWIGNDPRRRYRLPDQLFLSRIRLKPNQIGTVGQWTEEVVVPEAVQAVFENAKLSGIAFRPILHTRSGEPIQGYAHLIANHALGHRDLDIASPEIVSKRPEEQGYESLGCLCYDPATLASAADINRTGEQMVGFEFPGWVVRASVREVFEQHALKGWVFEPVMELGTPAFDEYTELWSTFRQLLASCRKHTVRSQKFH